MYTIHTEFMNPLTVSCLSIVLIFIIPGRCFSKIHVKLEQMVFRLDMSFLTAAIFIL